jgi:uncharacterized protein YecT (DUF1311 family)
MRITVILILLSAQASTANAMQAGPKTQAYVDAIMGTPSPVNYPPFSADKIGTNEYNRCVETDSSNANVGRCLSTEYDRKNSRLNATFARKLKSADLNQRRLMVKAQAVWKQFRAANCLVRSETAGSGAAIFYYGCLVRETNQRIAELQGNWDY